MHCAVRLRCTCSAPGPRVHQSSLAASLPVGRHLPHARWPGVVRKEAAEHALTRAITRLALHQPAGVLALLVSETKRQLARHGVTYHKVSETEKRGEGAYCCWHHTVTSRAVDACRARWPRWWCQGALAEAEPARVCVAVTACRTSRFCELRSTAGRVDAGLFRRRFLPLRRRRRCALDCVRCCSSRTVSLARNSRMIMYCNFER
jgi:hypothetical protein